MKKCPDDLRKRAIELLNEAVKRGETPTRLIAVSFHRSTGKRVSSSRPAVWQDYLAQARRELRDKH